MYSREDFSDEYDVQPEYDVDDLESMWVDSDPQPERFQDRLNHLKEFSPLADAAWFVDLFKPYLGRYTAYVHTAGQGRTWITRRERFSIRALQQAIDGTYQLGWYSSIATPVLGIDIDDHVHGGWRVGKREPLPELRTRYERIRDSFPVLPSMVVLSPHGLHLYYLLTSPLHYRNLQTLARKTLPEIPVELKPTPSTTLRVPARKWMLHPESLTRLYPTPDRGIDWSAVPVYQREILFGPDWRVTLRETDFMGVPARKGSSSDRTARLAGRAPVAVDSLKEVELEVLPFRNNETNEQVFKLVVACRKTGFSLQETIDRVLWWIDRSPGYTGPLKDNADALENKVSYIYGARKTRPAPEAVDISEYAQAIDDLVARHPFVPQRTKAVRRFLEKLVGTKKRHDLISASKSLTRYEDDKYEYYRLNRTRGVYPLPSKTLKAWNTNYTSILEWLLDIGLLEESGRGYSPLQHVCKHYFIHIDLPSEDNDTDNYFDESFYV